MPRNFCEVPMRKFIYFALFLLPFYSCNKCSFSQAEEKLGPPKVSVICPTYGRADRHQLLYAAFKHQTYENKELLVYDDSPSPSPFFQTLSDNQVTYFYNPAKKTIGAKRNHLAKMATGEIIAHFDDDDYYAPSYLQKMVEKLGDKDLVKISKWMAWREMDGTLWEWDTTRIGDSHYNVSGWEEKVVRFDLSKSVPQQEEFNEANTWGYGFSFVYRKSLWEEVPFEDSNAGEDSAFAKKAMALSKNMAHFPDEDHIVLHVIHRQNVSKIFPQYQYDRLEGPQMLGPEAAFWMMIQ